MLVFTSARVASYLFVSKFLGEYHQLDYLIVDLQRYAIVSS